MRNTAASGTRPAFASPGLTQDSRSGIVSIAAHPHRSAEISTDLEASDANSPPPLPAVLTPKECQGCEQWLEDSFTPFSWPCHHRRSWPRPWRRSSCRPFWAASAQTEAANMAQSTVRRQKPMSSGSYGWALSQHRPGTRCGHSGQRKDNAVVKETTFTGDCWGLGPYAAVSLTGLPEPGPTPVVCGQGRHAGRPGRGPRGRAVCRRGRRTLARLSREATPANRKFSEAFRPFCARLA